MSKREGVKMNELKSNMRLLALKQQRQSVMYEMKLAKDSTIRRALETKLKAIDKQLSLFN